MPAYFFLRLILLILFIFFNPVPSFCTSSESPMAPQELIIKLDPSAGKILNEALQEKHPPARTGLPWLDLLNRQYAVISITPLLPPDASPEETRQKYPQRTQRRNPEENSPDLGYVYLFQFKSGIDLKETARIYSENPQVVYVHPNAVMSIQTR